MKTESKIIAAIKILCSRLNSFNVSQQHSNVSLIDLRDIVKALQIIFLKESYYVTFYFDFDYV